MLTYGPYVVAAKESLLKLPFLNKELTDFMGMVALGRRNPREDLVNMLRDGTERIARGDNFLIFPQGTRVPAGVPRRPLRRGAAQIALHTGAPILPVSITCDPPVLAKGQPWYQLADRIIVYTLTVGDEIPVVRAEGSGTHAAAVALTERIGTALDI